MAVQALLLAGFAQEASAHGAMTIPPNRAGGNASYAGLLLYGSENVGYWWFSQPVTIPGEPTLNDEEHRTYNVKVKDGDKDWTHKMPWRSPGAAPVRGSGCGVSGGAPVPVPNGGISMNETLWPYGMDGLDLPETQAVEWRLGSVVEVAFAMMANHGGGYSYRLCKKSGTINEECFQRNSLRFHGNTTWIQYSDVILNRTFDGTLDLPRFPLPRVVVPEDQVHPKGSHWARNPVPSCFQCDQSQCGSLLPNLSEPITGFPGQFGGDAWTKVEACAQQCSGFGLVQCLPGRTQFEEPLPGISGYAGQYTAMNLSSTGTFFSGTEGFQYNLVDEVEIPADLESGDYVLSWRWDCEQSPQIWENCADVRLVHSDVQV